MNNTWNNNGWMNQYPAPRYEVIKVSGEASARNFRMAPNSSALLLDESAPIIWYAQTDGTGYLTVTPFDVAPHQPKPQVDLNDLLTRVQKLEEQYVQQSNPVVATKQPKKQRQQPTAAATTVDVVD